MTLFKSVFTVKLRIFKTNSTRFIYIKKFISKIEPQPDSSSTGSTTSTPSTTTVLPDDRKGILYVYCKVCILGHP